MPDDIAMAVKGVPPTPSPKSRFRRLWNNRIVHFLFTHFLGYVLIFGLGVAVTLGKQYRSTRPFHHFWDRMVQEDSDTEIIVGVINLRVLPGGPAANATLPSNVPVISDADAIAAGELRMALQREYKGRKFNLHLAPPPEAISQFEPIRSNLIAIGGGSVNSITADLLPKLNKNLRIVYPDHYAEDGGVRFLPDYDKNHAVLEDYGFIVVGENPYAPGKTVCLLFGIWPQGTQAAVEAVLRPDDSPRTKTLLELVQDHKSVVARVKARALGFVQGMPSIEDVREVKAQ